ncbi:glutamate--tRNA ligase, partial [Candidatus Peregrinibacteria bacterium]|nr:glutamate--tRNA ligase [Candidatus Peregrinibacteria bacterium]
KSDGMPTYHLANVVDDHEMEVTHVVRGEEWLPSTPKHLWLYKAFGWTPPAFAHLPLLLNADKTKLSKRQGDVAAEDYIKKGYLKEAMINFIAFLGWNPGGEKEIYTMDELIADFSFEKVQKAGAVFGLEKLDWLNGLYIRKKSTEELGELILPYLHECPWYKDELVTRLKEDQKKAILACVQTRMKTLSDGPAMLKPFLLDELEYNLELFNHEKMKVDKATAVLAVENAIPALEKLEDWTSETPIKAALTEVITKLGVKNGQVLWPLRVALTNTEFSPGVFELMVVMGKEKSIKRLKSAKEFLCKQ